MKIQKLYLQQIKVKLSKFTKKLYTSTVSMFPIRNRLRIRQTWTAWLFRIRNTKSSAVNNSGNWWETRAELSTCDETRVDYLLITKLAYLKLYVGRGKGHNSLQPFRVTDLQQNNLPYGSRVKTILLTRYV